MAADTPALTHVIDRVEQLEELYTEPSERARRKVIDHLDDHCRDFLARSPFAVLSTSSASGRCDASPRGGAPGFVRVLDEHRLALPDAAGNRRVDSLRNLVDNPRAGLLFLMPGLGETLRVNGRATITRDPRLLNAVAPDGRRPIVAIVVEVEEVYLHCAKSLLRAGLWDPGSWPTPAERPFPGRILRDHARLDRTPEEVQAALDEGYATRL